MPRISPFIWLKVVQPAEVLGTVSQTGFSNPVCLVLSKEQGHFPTQSMTECTSEIGMFITKYARIYIMGEATYNLKIQFGDFCVWKLKSGEFLIGKPTVVG